MKELPLMFNKAFMELLAHQTEMQIKLTAKANDGSSFRISQGWNNIHFGLSMLDAVIEEAIEAKRWIKARKWWASKESLEANSKELMSGTPERHEFIEELADIFIVWLNVLVFFSVSPSEFIKVLESKLERNNPDNSKSDLGHRS